MATITCLGRKFLVSFGWAEIMVVVRMLVGLFFCIKYCKTNGKRDTWEIYVKGDLTDIRVWTGKENVDLRPASHFLPLLWDASGRKDISKALVNVIKIELLTNTVMLFTSRRILTHEYVSTYMWSEIASVKPGHVSIYGACLPGKYHISYGTICIENWRCFMTEMPFFF